MGQKILGNKNVRVKNFYLGQIDLDLKFVWLKKTGMVNPRWRIYDPPPKNIVGLEILSQKFFGLIDLNPKFVLSKEKTGRVNPRWRIYEPKPPRKY